MRIIEQTVKRDQRCRMRCQRIRPVRFFSFLAPNMFSVYASITRILGEQLGIETELLAGSSYDDLASEADAAFICGLAYVELSRRRGRLVEPLAAPVLQDIRCGNRPICFSDVVVRRDSPFQSFTDLRGCAWAYNEPYSQSGYGILRHHLIQLRQTNGYFGKVVKAGWHEKSISMVVAGDVDASAIDSHVLAVALRDHPELASGLRVIDTLGPSTIQPLVVSCRLPESLKADLQTSLLKLRDDPDMKQLLFRAFVERFVAVADSDYNDIREMLAEAQAANFMQIK